MLCKFDFKGNQVLKIDRAIAALVPTMKKISSCLKKIRAKSNEKKRENYSNLELTSEYSIMLKNEPDLKYDNKSCENRIMIFVDNESLKILSGAETWFIDGSFKCEPFRMMQLFTIHRLLCNLKEKVRLPFVFVLTQKRTKKTYREEEDFELSEINLSLPDQNLSLPEQNIPNISCELTNANLETVRNLAAYSAELDFSDNNDSLSIIESLKNSENVGRMRQAKRDEQERETLLDQLLTE
ncbi:hypothetical protein BpHYR1_031079 [Brachionus plicatilis]|uniref:Uncharacterized protein n=1 Tax=Brachionus plicatilis TaxID=10195 RepID=A0A3M7RI38_BRAPC|nr:hypothetical protein BpHYR1_031079 [Brachionus plicatilis]